MYSGFGPYLHLGLASGLIEMRESARRELLLSVYERDNGKNGYLVQLET